MLQLQSESLPAFHRFTWKADYHSSKCVNDCLLILRTSGMLHREYDSYQITDQADRYCSALIGGLPDSLFLQVIRVAHKLNEIASNRS
jgi:hypothetical protein